MGSGASIAWAGIGAEAAKAKTQPARKVQVRALNRCCRAKAANADCTSDKRFIN